MTSGAAGGGGNVLRGAGGRQDLVDHVDDPVARWHIGCGDGCAVDRNRCSDAEGKGLTVDGGFHHAVADVGGRNRTRNDVIAQKV